MVEYSNPFNKSDTYLSDIDILSLLLLWVEYSDDILNVCTQLYTLRESCFRPCIVCMIIIFIDDNKG